MRYLIVLALLLSGCSGSVRYESKPAIDAIESETRGTVDLFTVEHDGHKFILGRITSGSAMVHHPDCPCQKVEN